MMKRIQLLSIIVGLGFITTGMILGWQPLMQSWHQPQIAQAQSMAATLKSGPLPAPQPVLIEGHPVRIQIPSLAVDLSVINGYYNTTSKTWTLTSDKAQYATNTQPANNQQGNTFIYGHNRAQVFQSLYKLQVGQQAIISTDTGHTFTYRFTGSIVTTPYDDSLFTYQGPPILTLQTCSGLWYQNRQLFHFNLVGAA